MLKPLTTAQKVVLGVLVGVILGSAFWVAWRRSQPLRSLAPAALPAPSQAAPGSTIMVSVTGEVARPGLYTLPRDARTIQALKAAGGVTPAGDPNSVSLAQRLKDGASIVVKLRRVAPGKAPPAAPALTSESHAATAAARASRAAPAPPATAARTPVSLNSASLAELAALPGVGLPTAQRIVAYRREHPFRQIEELLLVRGITTAEFDKLRPYLTL